MTFLPADAASRPATVTTSGRAARRRRPVPWCGPARRCVLHWLGSAATKCSTENGRYRRTLSTPTFSPRRSQVFHGLVRDFGARAHDDDHALGIRRAHVVEQVVLAADELGELVHRVLHDGGAGEVVGVARLRGPGSRRPGSGRCRAARDGRGTGRGRGGPATRSSSIMARMSSSVSCSTLATSWEVRKPSKKCRNGTRDSRRGRLGDQGHVHDFLDGVGGRAWPKPGRAGGHDVAVVAEDGEGVGGHGAGGDVEDRGGQLAGDLDTCWGSSAAGPGRR